MLFFSRNWLEVSSFPKDMHLDTGKTENKIPESVVVVVAVAVVVVLVVVVVVVVVVV